MSRPERMAATQIYAYPAINAAGNSQAICPGACSQPQPASHAVASIKAGASSNATGKNSTMPIARSAFTLAIIGALDAGCH